MIPGPRFKADDGPPLLGSSFEGEWDAADRLDQLSWTLNGLWDAHQSTTPVCRRRHLCQALDDERAANDQWTHLAAYVLRRVSPH